MLISEFVVFDCRAFFIIQCLAGLSTVIDVARHQPTPTPFGSQHVALILVGWGPAVVFGEYTALRSGPADRKDPNIRTSTGCSTSVDVLEKILSNPCR